MSATQDASVHQRPMRDTVAVILARFLPGRTSAAIALVSSARDVNGNAWGPPQGPLGERGTKASVLDLLQNECGITEFELHPIPLFEEVHPEARGGAKHFTWHLCFTPCASLRPVDHTSVAKVTWVHNWADMQAMIVAASPTKKDMIERAVREASRHIGWQCPE